MSSETNTLFKHAAVNSLIENIREMYRNSRSDGEHAIVKTEDIQTLYQQAVQILNNPVTIDLGIHHHRHGESYYLVETDKPVTTEEMMGMLEEDFEPGDGETIEILHNAGLKILE